LDKKEPGQTRKQLGKWQKKLGTRLTTLTCLLFVKKVKTFRERERKTFFFSARIFLSMSGADDSGCELSLAFVDGAADDSEIAMPLICFVTLSTESLCLSALEERTLSISAAPASSISRPFPLSFVELAC